MFKTLQSGRGDHYKRGEQEEHHIQARAGESTQWHSLPKIFCEGKFFCFRRATVFYWQCLFSIKMVAATGLAETK